MHEKDIPQFVLTATVWHGPTFGHSVELETTSSRGALTHDNIGSWSTLGIPTQVLEGICTTVHAVLEEHLVTRYGVLDELPTRWAGDPEPF